MTELRSGRAQQGRNTGSRTLARQAGDALDRLGAMINENIRGNRERGQRDRQERQRVDNDRGPERERQYIAGGAQRSDVARVSERVASMRQTRGIPQAQPRSRTAPYLARHDLQEAVDLTNEANVRDARVRDASVSEEVPIANGAELTRGDGQGRRGVLQRPFTVRVEGEDVAISDQQRVALSEYLNEHPRAFDSFADWFNAISTLNGVTPDQLSVEDVAMARRQWQNPQERGGPTRGLAPPDAEFTLDPEYVRRRGAISYGAEYPYQNIDQGIDPETGQRRIVGVRTGRVRGPQGPMPDAPESARRPITPEERLTAESELMRIVNGNRARSGAGRSRTMQRASGGNAQEPNLLELPRQVAEMVIAGGRLAETRGRVQAETEDMRREVRADGKPNGSKQAQRGTLMTAEQVREEEASRVRSGDALNGLDLNDEAVDPFTRERILPVRKVDEDNRGSETLRRLNNARVRIGNVDIEPDDNGLRGSVRW